MPPTEIETERMYPGSIIKEAEGVRGFREQDSNSARGCINGRGVSNGAKGRL